MSTFTRRNGEWHSISRFWNPGRAELPPIAMINIYCDESHDAHTYALAGWVTMPEYWDAITGQWDQMLRDLGMPEFHAVEIVERDHISDSRFKGWTFEQEIAAFTRATDILVEPSHYLIAIGSSVSIPQHKDEFGFETEDIIWVFLFNRLLTSLVRAFPDEHGVSLMFDEKEEVRTIVNDSYYPAKELVEKHRPGYFRGSTVGFGKSQEKPPLQAADLFAYEWRKRISDRVRTPDKKPRRSYKRLRDSRCAYLHHIDRSLWTEYESRTKDPRLFLSLLLNAEGTEE